MEVETAICLLEIQTEGLVNKVALLSSAGGVQLDTIRHLRKVINLTKDL